MGNKHRNKDKSKKGMNTQSQSKQNASHSNMQFAANGSSEILSQSRNILYGQDGTNVPFSEPGELMNGNVYQNMPNSMPNSTQMNSVPMNRTQGQMPGLQYSQGPVNMNNGINNSQSSNGSSMPPWAATMCQQLQNIQLQLETQNKRWQTVEGQMHNQNVRMTQIETQINQLNIVSQKMSETSTKVNKIDTEVVSVKSKITEYEKSVNYCSELCDDILDKNTEYEDRLTELDDKISMIDEKLLDVQWRSMRENLIFSGIDETISRAGDFEDCEGRIRSFIREVMGISKLIDFDRVHRLGRFRPGQSRPRPIVAKFTFYRDKEYVRQEAPKVLIGTGYSVNEQFPQEIETRRKVLYPVAKSARQNQSNKVRLVRDKLYINGQLYLPEQTTDTTNTSQQHPQRRLSTQRETRNYRTPSTRNSNRHTNGQLYIGNRFPSDLINRRTRMLPFDLVLRSVNL